jgi:hypothetical protein
MHDQQHSRRGHGSRNGHTRGHRRGEVGKGGWEGERRRIRRAPSRLVVSAPRNDSDHTYRVARRLLIRRRRLIWEQADMRWVRETGRAIPLAPVGAATSRAMFAKGNVAKGIRLAIDQRDHGVNGVNGADSSPDLWTVTPIRAIFQEQTVIPVPAAARPISPTQPEDSPRS